MFMCASDEAGGSSITVTKEEGKAKSYRGK